MILQALTQLYYDLCAKTTMPLYGYSNVGVSAIVMIDINGHVVDVVPSSPEKDKMVDMLVPIHFKRSGSLPKPYYLCDLFPYIFGIEPEGKKYKGNNKNEREAAKQKEIIDAKHKFDKFKLIHEQALGKINNPEAKALLNYFANWNTEGTNEIAAANEAWSFASKGNLVFRCINTGCYLHEVPEIRNAIISQMTDDEESIIGTCLVTGETGEIARIHNSVKGIASSNPSPNGYTLVSFDKDSLAFSSFGKIQGENAPISKKTEFAYTTALDYLLSNKEYVRYIGDRNSDEGKKRVITVVFWAKGAEPQYNRFSTACLWNNGLPEGMSENDLRAAVKSLSEGKPCKEFGLKPDTEFYILGFSPNATRIAVRFFYRSSFGELMKNVNAHHERMQIDGNKYPYMPLWALMKETAKLKEKQKPEDKDVYIIPPSPVLIGSVARAIFTGALYPVGLLEATMLRIRAERKITSGRAAIIKAYYLRNENPSCPKEVLTVSLNENSTNIPYVLGRLFAVYEKAQTKANGWDKDKSESHTTIRDKFFNSAASSPAIIFSSLGKLYTNHLRKMDKGSQVYFEKQVSELLGIIGETFPARLSLPEQGAFQLGYYHQQQKRYEKKEN